MTISKKILFLLIVAVAFITAKDISSNNIINGVMIDCSRLLERHEYYYKLIDFMSEWKMNTLLFHFSDDHGMSIRLPGYEKIARKHAFTPEEIRDLIAYAAQHEVDIIPELEVFGHTRYITDHPDFAHLFLGDRSGSVSFNAIDPRKDETIDLMRGMINELVQLFPSQYLHLGCDEVNLSVLGLDEKDESWLWANYVNKMIGIVHAHGKMPMIWNDHLVKNDRIAPLLRKDVVLVEWNYSPNYQPKKLPELTAMGFKNILMAPSISCWLLRVLPSDPGLKNVDAHAASVRDNTAQGMINTVWLPMRYSQNTMWYGIAYSAFLVNSGKPMDRTRFHKQFVKRVFGKRLNRKMDDYLTGWTRLYLDRRFYSAIINNNKDFLSSSERIDELNIVHNLSKNLMNNTPRFIPKKNEDILESIYLSVRTMYVLSEGLLIMNCKSPARDRIDLWQKELQSVIVELEQEWDEGRYPDDPAKYTAQFPNQANSHLLIVLRKLDEMIFD